MRIGRYCQVLFLVRHSGRLITVETQENYPTYIFKGSLLLLFENKLWYTGLECRDLLVLVEDDCDLSYSSRWKEMVRFRMNFEGNRVHRWI